MGGLAPASMRHNPAEKREIILLVEHSSLPVKKTLAELGIPKSTFYRWYGRYQDYSMEAVKEGPDRRGLL
ncbi:MAG: helix-turn-helix domain-containing protein [Anaerolineales bacterium]|nr:MAG: helix-turn-helix domain-containing protein [Anaerolineales bacterium]